ncbi:MAG: putative tryptophan/tyrosine transport system ATP-binding protein [Clostridia bacterium]|jgi:putative ABC transport system ATP-binding protein|nr:transporter related protein [Clostridiales bacterium]MDK2984589.1 putative tryptophan/tyrosine transport system ATP-binding protein [Clostridia bacterium]
MLKVKEVKKTFNPGTINEKLALNNVNLNINAGEWVTVIGSNGAGKSTLLNVIAGVFPVDYGSIYIDGQSILHQPEHKRASYIGRVFQDPLMGTAASMTVIENLSLALKRGEKRKLIPGISRKDRHFFQEKLSQLGLGLEDRLSVKVGLLSGGQRQALTLLMATLKKPKLLLLDEHTAALDPKTGQRVVELTKEIIEKEKITTLMITHNLEQALKYGTRTIMMDEGQIVLDIKGQHRNNTSIQDLLALFEKASGKALNNDRVLLA